MRNGKVRFLLAIPCLATIFASLSPASPPVQALTAQPHPPIRIIGDGEFTTGNGIIGGSGKVSDPFVIGDWEISAASSNGVEIQDTVAFFVIRNVIVQSGGASGYNGTVFVNAANGRLENSNITGDWDGVVIDSSSNINLSGNSVQHNSHAAIEIFSSTNIRILQNDLSNNEDIGDSGGPAITAKQSSNVDISTNSLDNEGYGGIKIVNSTNLMVSENQIAGGSGQGINISSSQNIMISRNSLTDTRFEGISVSGSNTSIVGNDVSGTQLGYLNPSAMVVNGTLISIKENTISQNAIGVTLYYASYAMVYHNNFMNNGRNAGIGCTLACPFVAEQALDNNWANNHWDAGYPNGGNYWSDYNGVDNCNGPSQDKCPYPDGIGDTRYNYVSLFYRGNNVTDRYPLMKPFPTTSATTGALEISVSGPNSAVQGAKVSIISRPVGQVRPAARTTGSDGLVLFSRLLPGDYAFGVAASGYADSWRAATVIAGQIQHSIVRLSAVQPAPTAPVTFLFLEIISDAVLVTAAVVLLSRWLKPHSRERGSKPASSPETSAQGPCARIGSCAWPLGIRQ